MRAFLTRYYEAQHPWAVEWRACQQGIAPAVLYGAVEAYLSAFREAPAAEHRRAIQLPKLAPLALQPDGSPSPAAPTLSMDPSQCSIRSLA